MKVIPFALAGFVAGAVLGFLWGQATRSKIGDNVKTSVYNGVVTVSVDAKTAALQGLKSLVGG